MTAEILNAESLLEAARGDAESFAAFYRLFERQVLAFFLRATRRPELAADLAAETFARALESIESYDPDRGRADQWLFGIARNVLGSSYRRGKVESDARERLGMPRLCLSDHESEAIERLTAIQDPVRTTLASLPEEQQHAIKARVLDEREYSEIAGELRCSEALVRQRVSRGLKTLRERIAGER